MTETDQTELLSQYAESAQEWNSLNGSEVKKANRIFARLHGLAKQLRQTPAGRAGLVELAGHDVIGIRLLAAAECLPWSPEMAVPTLEAIEDLGGLYAVDARYTLKSYRAGTLNMDW